MTLKITSLGHDELDSFLDLPRRLHASDPLWVAPLRESNRAEVTGRNSFGRFGMVQPFLARRDGEPIGRLAAIVNPGIRRDDGSPVGQIGHFESIDDPRVTGALLEAAFGWLRERGSRVVWGPMHGGVQRPHRFQTAGFDRTPFLSEPRNPPYYPALFEGYGFRRSARWTSFDLPASALSELPARLGMDRILTRIGGHYRIDHLSTTDLPAALRRIHPLLDSVWAGHHGYAPFDLEELAETFGPILAMLAPREVGLVVDTRTGEDVGCGFVVPDSIDAVRGLDGDATGWGSWCGGPRPPRLIFHTFAVRAGTRGRGAAFVLLESAIRHAIEEGYEEIVVALAVDTVRTIWERVAEPSREYALYARSI